MAWYDAAEQNLLGKFDEAAVAAINSDYRAYVRAQNGEVDPADVPDFGADPADDDFEHYVDPNQQTLGDFAAGLEEGAVV
jgi:hypothetical protein